MTFGRELVDLGAFLEVVMRRFDRRSFLCQFVEGQTHFGMSRGAKNELALNEPKWVAFHYSKHSLKDAPEVEINY